MTQARNPVKTTIVGGLIFLVPLVVLIVVIAKMFEIMAVVAAPLSTVIPIKSIGGIAMVNILAVVAILLICYIAGHIAISGPGRRLYRALDDKLLMLFPRYSFIKSMADSYGSDEAKQTLQTVLVKLDDQSQIGFEVERKDGLVTVYMPGSPDPWSGMVVFVTEDRVELLDAKFNEVVSSLRGAGQGAGQLLGQADSKIEKMTS